MTDIEDDKMRQDAYLFWYRGYPHKLVDLQVKPFLQSNISASKPDTGWLRRARQALFLSTGRVATSLNISRSAYAKLERKELMGTVMLKTICDAADAMDCEFVYGIRPKSRKPFSQVIWKKISEEGCRHPWVKSRPQNRKAVALAAVANWIIDNPLFRKKNNLANIRRRENAEKEIELSGGIEFSGK